MVFLRVFISSALLLSINVDCSPDVIKSIASGFMKVLDVCKHELGLTDQIISDLYHYWKLEYSFLNRDTGCAIICMSKKLDLIDPNGRLHHGNTKDLAVKHGASDEVASKVVMVIHDCEKEFDDLDDDCMRVLEVAKCLRTGVFELNWSPKMDVIVSEILTEI